MIPAALFLLASGQTPPAIVDRLEDDGIARAGFVVELMERPIGIDSADFAQQLVHAERLQPWNGDHQGTTAHGLHVISRLAADGRNVVVYYLPSERREARGRVCRIRARTTGQSDARWRAFRWCHSAFGLRTPQTPQSPITSVTRVR